MKSQINTGPYTAKRSGIINKAKVSAIICAAFLSILLTLGVNAEAGEKNRSALFDAQSDIVSADRLLAGLPDKTREALAGMGITSLSFDGASSVDAGRFMSQVFSMLRESSKTPLCGMGVCFGIILLCSMTEGFRLSSSENKLSPVQNTVASACICTAVIVPLCATIGRTAEVLGGASGFMLLYAPILAGLLLGAGREVTAAGYYTSMLTAGNAVSLAASRLVVPLMNVFLSLSVTSSLSPKLRLGSVCAAVHKTAKWILVFVMTVFLAIMSLNTMVNSSMDSVSKRALRFTLSSFTPVVGGALSEALNTFGGSLELLRSGAGVIVIISSALIILPVLLECIVWQISLFVLSSAAEIAGLDMISGTFRTVSKAAEMLTALLLSVLTVFIISTGVILLAGGE